MKRQDYSKRKWTSYMGKPDLLLTGTDEKVFVEEKLKFAKLEKRCSKLRAIVLCLNDLKTSSVREIFLDDRSKVMSYPYVVV